MSSVDAALELAALDILDVLTPRGAGWPRAGAFAGIAARGPVSE